MDDSVLASLRGFNGVWGRVTGGEGAPDCTAEDLQRLMCGAACLEGSLRALACRCKSASPRLNRLADGQAGIVRRLRAEQPDLFRTIATLCGNGMNYAAAAEALFLHPKTVRYRAERVRELYGLDTRTSDDFIQVVLADKIFALKREG